MLLPSLAFKVRSQALRNMEDEVKMDAEVAEPVAEVPSVAEEVAPAADEPVI